MKFLPVIDRLMAKVEFSANGCWLFNGMRNAEGYGVIKVGVQSKLAHRVAWQELNGDIPPGMNLDHKCHDPKTCSGGRECLHRNCINPDHLELATQAQNCQRDRTVNRNFQEAVDRKRLQTHCKSGHEFSFDNIYIDSNGHRDCKICRRAVDERRRRAKGIPIRSEYDKIRPKRGPYKSKQTPEPGPR